jgi:hypothetical protein
MAVKILDYLQSRITNVGGIAAADLSVGITPGDGAKIIADVPAINTDDWVYAWLKDDAGNREVIRVTAVAVDVLTIVRGINSRYPARAWAQGDIVHFALSKSLFDDMHTTVTDALADVDAALVDLAAAEAALTNIAAVVMTFTNKTHTLPKINEDVELTATATELNQLDGKTAVNTTDNQTIGGIKNFSGTFQIGGVPVSYVESTITAGGDLVGTNRITLVRVGKQVTMQWISMTHSTGHTVYSADGIVQVGMRPTVEVKSLYGIPTDGIAISFVGVTASGKIYFIYKTLEGLARSQAETFTGSLSWLTT